MSIQHTITKMWQGKTGAAPVAQSVTLTASEELNLDFQLAASTSNQLQPLAFTKTDLQSVFISTDQNITIKTNSSSVPQDTLTITAGDPFQWDVNSGVTNPFAGDVTSGYFSNANTSVANISVRVLTNG